MLIRQENLELPEYILTTTTRSPNLTYIKYDGQLAVLRNTPEGKIIEVPQYIAYISNGFKAHGRARKGTSEYF